MSGDWFDPALLWPAMRALILGHFSTVGDVDSLAYVTETLREEGVAYDVLPFIKKLSGHIDQAIDRSDLNPLAYTHLIVVCGPLWPDLLTRRGVDLHSFAHCTRIGVNLTMIEPIDEWNPFHILLERDSDKEVRPDLTFLRSTGRVPVAGLCMIESQREYGSRQRHGEAVHLLRKLVVDRSLAAVEIDTRWPAFRNSGGLASPAQVASVIGRTDVLLTNRLHGLVYALKIGVPALAIDPVDGGGKVTAQGKVLGWPAVATVDAASFDWLDRMLDWCLSDEGRRAADAIAGRAVENLRHVGDQLRAALRAEFSYRPIPPSPAKADGGFKQRLVQAIRRGWRH